MGEYLTLNFIDFNSKTWFWRYESFSCRSFFTVNIFLIIACWVVQFSCLLVNFCSKLVCFKWSRVRVIHTHKCIYFTHHLAYTCVFVQQAVSASFVSIIYLANDFKLIQVFIIDYKHYKHR